MPITEEREYQRDGIEMLKAKKRAILWDQPGLGKTYEGAQAAKELLIDHLAEEPDTERKRILVVCPGYLVLQWADYLKEQYPDECVKYTQPYATKEERLRLIFSKHNWLVVNKEMLRQYPFLTHQYYVMILDESHHFRNKDAAQSKGALELAMDIPCVLMLTATPVKKDADDLYMQFHILDPDTIASYHQFINTYLSVTRSGFGMKVDGIRFADKLKMVMARYGMGRTYKEVDLQLPKLTSKKEFVLLNKEESTVYKEIAIFWRNQEKTYNNYLSAMQALRQVTACEAKFDAAKQLADDLEGPGVFFCWYKNTAHRLYEELGSDNAVLVTGDVTQYERPIRGKSGKHVVCTIASMSEGVDLSHASEVAFLEEDWTPGSRVQALARVRRWSSNNDENKRVIAHYIMVKNTVDEKVHAATEGRIMSINEIMDLEFAEYEEDTNAS